jgi:hypothetical protein
MDPCFTNSYAGKMADWIVCPACRLRHVARPDGACPRCKQPIAGAVPLATVATATDFGLPGSSTEARPAGLPAGARIAAWVLLANALAAIPTLALTLTRTTPSEPAGMGSVLPVIVDVVIATSLLRGNPRYQSWALVRAVLGGLILTPMLWITAGPAMGLTQALYSIGLVLLLVGEPGVARIASGLVPAMGTLLLMVAMSASDEVGRRVQAVVADVSDGGAHVERIERREGGWRLELPAGTWHEHKAPKGVDRMVSWPEEDAHLMITSQTAPAGTQLDIVKATDVVLGEARKAMPGLVERERKSFGARRGSGMAVHVSQTMHGTGVESWYVVFVDGNRLAVAVAMGPRDRFDEIGETLLGVAEKLEL